MRMGEHGEGWRDLLDLSPDSVIVYDRGGVVRYWNAAAERLYGWSASAMVGHNLDPLSPAGWLPAAALAATDRWSGVVRRRTIRGVEADIHVSLAVWGDALAEFGRVATSMNVPEQAPQVFADCGTSFPRLIEHMPIPIWEIDARAAGQNFARLHDQGVTDLDAHLDAHPEIVDFTCDTVLISRVNHAATRLFAAPDASALLGPIRYLYTETPGTAKRIMVAHWNRQRHHVEEMRVRTCDGRVIDVMFLATFLQLPEEQATTFLMLIDISDRVRAEAEIATLKADFAHAARVATLGELISSIGQELRAPLAAAAEHGRAIEKVLDAAVPDLAAVRRGIDAVMRQASGANETISRVRDMAVKAAPRRAPVTINAVARTALSLVAHECKVKEIAIRTDLAPDLPVIMADTIQLQQVMVNLLFNAMHALDRPCAGAREIAVLTAAGEGQVMVEVRDTGCGIAPDDLERVFNSFVSTREDALGVGLAICRSIVEAHDGSIEAGNMPGGGAVVRFRIPILAGAAA